MSFCGFEFGCTFRWRKNILVRDNAWCGKIANSIIDLLQSVWSNGRRKLKDLGDQPRSVLEKTGPSD